ncbi:TM2 domain-containing protein [Anaerobacillus sp. 1_MG-2023]|uniref:TM2 domain-containing protein n=1 Tax=Anaerobacillus sp. 1_MG-2023 TaxID=3062655 RepID=UPI0026E48E23|nr:TM2 domain-containing protein [Anaerobacillus sp. 1_MG-2023]MDO6657839.1 TM2 domain-containing protein [Anaerobacillus sp. 1_MG-2023]
MGLSCYIHEDQSSIGTCVGCGKFICQECNTEVKRKNYCKTCIGEIMSENQSKIERLEESKNNSNPMVFMNAGGGGGASSSAASSSGSVERDQPIFSKNRIAAGVLAILLGSIGAHKFYLGRWGWGIIYLLFSWTWIPTIVGIIEGVIYLFSSDESFAAKHDRNFFRRAA